MPIPRIIHQTYKSVEQLPKHWQKSHVQWQEFCKLHGFTYMFWDDASLDTVVRDVLNKEQLEFYDNLPYTIQRIDIARCVILYQYGGMYVDMDICVKPNSYARFEHLFGLYEHSCQLAFGESSSSKSFGSVGATFTNALMMSVVGSDFWTFLFDRMLQHPERSNAWKFLLSPIKHYYIINSTGPGLINDVTYHYNKQDPKPNSVIMLIPSSLTAPAMSWEEKPTTSDTSTVEILNGGSWESLDSKIAHGAEHFWAYHDYVFIPLMIVFFIIVIVLSVMMATVA